MSHLPAVRPWLVTQLTVDQSEHLTGIDRTARKDVVMVGGGRSCMPGTQAGVATRADRIRQLNDEFRSNFDGGNVLITVGVRRLGDPDVGEIISRVQHFQDFKVENDPYGEHDFGVFKWNSHSIYWKIDYYDPDLQLGSADPADPQITRRVLTIMLAQEY